MKTFYHSAFLLSYSTFSFFKKTTSYFLMLASLPLTPSIQICYPIALLKANGDLLAAKSLFSHLSLSSPFHSPCDAASHILLLDTCSLVPVAFYCFFLQTFLHTLPKNMSLWGWISSTSVASLVTSKRMPSNSPSFTSPDFFPFLQTYISSWPPGISFSAYPLCTLNSVYPKQNSLPKYFPSLKHPPFPFCIL